jgi:hypothetical protein
MNFLVGPLLPVVFSLLSPSSADCQLTCTSLTCSLDGQCSSFSCGLTLIPVPKQMPADTVPPPQQQ